MHRECSGKNQGLLDRSAQRIGKLVQREHNRGKERERVCGGRGVWALLYSTPKHSERMRTAADHPVSPLTLCVCVHASKNAMVLIYAMHCQTTTRGGIISGAWNMHSKQQQTRQGNAKWDLVSLCLCASVCVFVFMCLCARSVSGSASMVCDTARFLCGPRSPAWVFEFVFFPHSNPL